MEHTTEYCPKCETECWQGRDSMPMCQCCKIEQMMDLAEELGYTVVKREESR